MNRFFLSSLLCLCVLSVQSPVHAEWYESEHSSLEKAKRMYQSGRFDEARVMFSDLINSNAKSAETYYWRGVTYNSLGQADKALSDFNQTISLDSNNPKYYLGRGLLYSNKNQYDDAIADFDSALRLDPDNDMAATNKKFCVQAIADKQKSDEAKIAKAKVDADRIAAEKLAAEQLALNPAPVKKGRTSRTIPAKPVAVASAPPAVATPAVSSAQLRAFEKKQAELQVREQAVEAKLEKERLERQQLVEAKAEQQRLLKETKRSTSSSTRTAKKKEVDPEPVAVAVAAPAAEEPAGPPVNRPIRDKWALIVGISKFKDGTLNLRYPSKDAKDFYDFLITSAGFKKDHIKLLVDEEATRGRILSELGDKWLPRVANPDDLVVIYISSHGSASDMDVGGVNYLLAHDTDVDNLYASGLPMQDLTRIIKGRVHSDRIVLVLDACHSGATTVADSKGLTRRTNVNADEIAQGTGQLVISSSMPNQVSWESKKDQNSVFTKYLMEGLRTKPNLGEAFDFMKNKVQEEVLRERGVLQTPVLKSKWMGNELMIGAPAVNPSPALESEAQGTRPGQATH